MKSSALLVATFFWAALALASAPLADGKSYLASGSRHADEEGASVGTLMRQKRESPSANSTTRNSSSSGDKKKKPGKVKQRVFEIECLAAHNKWRRLHSAKELSFDKKIAAFAQKRADFIAASDGAEFRHPPDLPYGENLAWHSTETTNCHDLVKMWYDEVDMYDFNNPGFDAQTGHFTQLVWRSTERVGCARAVSDGPKGGVTLVCNYDPPGNFLGEFQDNVARAPKKVSRLSTTSTTTTSTSTTQATPTTTASVATVTTTSGRDSKPAAGSATAAPAVTSLEGITTPTSSSSSPLSESANQENKKKNKKDESNPKRKKGNKNKKKKKKKKKNKNKKKNQSAVTTTTTAPAQTTTTVALAAGRQNK